MFRKVSGRDEEALVVFDPDRPAVEAARLDPSRFETLYRRYVAQVYSFAVYQLADHHAAEDLTEQVFLQALAALPRFHEVPRATGTSSFRSWLFQIARHLSSNERRSARRHPTAPLDAALDVSSHDDPATAAARHDEAARAWGAVDRLPSDRRTAVILRFVEEMSIPEIAGVMGRSEGAVRVLLHRSLRSVANELRARGASTDGPRTASADGAPAARGTDGPPAARTAHGADAGDGARPT